MRRLAALLVLAAGPALAVTEFQPPQGCEGVLTVQAKTCLVSLVWQCGHDAPGEQWVAMFTGMGPFQVRKIDRDFQWLETYYTDRTERMEADPKDPASLTELISTGHDTYDFVVTTDDGAPPERVVGFDRLTGERVEIDGEPLLRTEFAYQSVTPDGELIYAGAGAQFVSERHHLFFLGTSWDQAAPEDVFDATPVEFIYPGEAGFFEAVPRYDCGAILSSSPGE